MRIEQNELIAETPSIQNQALAKTPDVRAENVARGKALVADPNYPSREQIKKIAHLLAANWEPADLSPQHLGATTPSPEEERRTPLNSARYCACIRWNRRNIHGQGGTAQTRIG